MGCIVDPAKPPPTEADLRERHASANGWVLRLVAFDTVLTATTIPLAQTRTTRIVAIAATGFTALSPLFYLGRFLDDTPVTVQVDVPLQLTYRF